MTLANEADSSSSSSHVIPRRSRWLVGSSRRRMSGCWTRASTKARRFCQPPESSAAGAQPVRARISAVEQDPEGTVRALIAGDGRRFAADVVIGADGALSPVAQLAGMLDSTAALWGFAIRAYVPAEVPLPLLVLLDAERRRIGR